MIHCLDGPYDHPLPLAATVPLTIAEVRRCFEGRPLDRAHAVAALSEEILLVLFPGDGGRRVSKHGLNLRRIGSRITSPEVCNRLRPKSWEAVMSAARYSRPEDQLRAAAQWPTRSKRTPRQKSTGPMTI